MEIISIQVAPKTKTKYETTKLEPPDVLVVPEPVAIKDYAYFRLAKLIDETFLPDEKV